MLRVSSVICVLLATSSAFAYTGADSTEVIVTFTSAVELNADQIADNDIEEQIADQAHYMFGPISDRFLSPSRSILGGILGAPRIDDQTRLFSKQPPVVFEDARPGAPRTPALRAPIITRGQPFPQGNRRFVRYNYHGPMVLKNGSIRKISGNRDGILLALPHNPKTIFGASERLKPRPNVPDSNNPCTDETFQSDGDFFYFWSPDRPGCRLQRPEHFGIVEATVQKLTNERSSFPEYSKLPDPRNGNILITLIMGKDTPSRVRDPFKARGRRDDLNAENFRKIAARIESAKRPDPRNPALKIAEFQKRVWLADEVKAAFTQIELSPQPFVVDYTHVYAPVPRGETPRAGSITIRMVFTNADIGIENSQGMHRFFKHSIEQGAVTIYDGHSGLGANLDLGFMREASRTSFRFNFPKNRYQIFFFNSCTSYAYYTDMFFDEKKVANSGDIKGSKFLDVLATGLETAFDGSENTNMALVDAIHLWGKTGAETSYQQLAARMEADNLFGVNGDEDNPKTSSTGVVAPPPPLDDNGDVQKFSVFPDVDPANPPPPLELPEFPNSAIEQGVVPKKEQ